MRALAAGVLALLPLLAGCGQPAPSAAVGNDFALQSASIDLPADIEPWPAGAGMLETQCGACHSAGMITTQPALKPEQWAATVKKMREVYKAPIAAGDVPAILAALERLPAAAPAAAAPAP